MKKRIKTPTFPEWILKKIQDFNNKYDVAEDFKESYIKTVQDKGKLKAYLWYWHQALLTLVGYLTFKACWGVIMLKNYLKIALRNIKRHKAYSLINITGLAVGMAVFILISLYVQYELSYDRYHENSDRIYRLAFKFTVAGEILNEPKTSHPMVETLCRNYPEVLNAVKLSRMDRSTVRYGETPYFEERIFFADESIFDIFSFQMIHGDPESSLSAPYTVVITADMAKKYFGDENPLGKVLNFNNQTDFTVTGIIKNVPKDSHFTFDMLCSFETIYANPPRHFNEWTPLRYYTYILLQENYDYREFEKKFPEFIETNMGAILKAVGATDAELYLQPLTSIYLHSNLQGEISVNGNIAYIYIFSVIALSILLIACINFINLATSRALIREKEVGVRKIFGADRGKLIMQFLSESLFYSFLSLIIALIIVNLFFPVINSLSGKAISFRPDYLFWLIPAFFGLMTFVGLIAGSFPAVVLSAFQPVKVLKGSLNSGTYGSRLRSFLVVFQFTISIIFIISTGIILNQLNYMKEKSLGFDKEHIIILPIRGINLIKEEWRELPAVVNVCASSRVPGKGTYRNPFIPEGYDQDQWMDELYIDQDFIPVMGLEIVAGRNFSLEFPSDINGSCIINETAVKKFGWDNPIGKTIRTYTGSVNNKTMTVIGVVKDFHTVSLHKLIEPLVIIFDPGMLHTTAVKIHSGNVTDALNSLRKKWEEIIPNRPFDYYFLDESFDSQYKADERLSKIYIYFTILAVFVASIGLFGLVSFTAGRRTKEIGIRKVLGASVPGIFALLSRGFIKWVILANLIAWPVVYYLMNKWLQNFAYRIDLSVWIFILSGLAALCIALLTVSYKSIKAATANPVDSLRYE